MDDMTVSSLVSAFPSLGIGTIFLAMAVKLFNYLMDSLNKFIRYLIDRNKYLEDQNKILIQALYTSSNSDAMRLASNLLSPKVNQTNVGED